MSHWTNWVNIWIISSTYQIESQVRNILHARAKWMLNTYTWKHDIVIKQSNNQSNSHHKIQSSNPPIKHIVDWLAYYNTLNAEYNLLAHLHVLPWTLHLRWVSTACKRIPTVLFFVHLIWFQFSFWKNNLTKTYTLKGIKQYELITIFPSIYIITVKNTVT